MTKNTAKIKAGIRTLANAPNEIISGTVIAGSIDAGAYTVSVLPSDADESIEGVMLNAISEDGNGVILFPKDESNVVIGCVDGPGEWTLIKASEITKAIITIANVKYEINDTHVSIQNGDVLFNVSNNVFKMNTASESLFQLLKDCFTYLTALTVSTSSGISSVPVNVADFSSLITRLNNLLSS
jgi:hypothetical protein